MATPKGTHFVVTASFLASGAPAYRRADGSWGRELSNAALFEEEAAAGVAVCEAAREEQLVADPYSFSVARRDDRPVPLTVRERIRAAGPTAGTGSTAIRLLAGTGGAAPSGGGDPEDEAA